MTVCFPGSLATKGNPYATLDDMWKAFDVYSSNKTLAVNSSEVNITQSMGRLSLGPPSHRGRSHTPRDSSHNSFPAGSARNPMS